ncbi:hypothetical protein COX93_01035 [Candidatus Nomurabacteria bacterium CG_4_10_14_0_2_um_filter_30_12]|uniref:Uncharacterized protein n=3 Tax=Candidatus Nomuraibacteriota TaxID=1752729 RepID=A0A1J4V695_9BACT|nr:MAG: hypothetical protein AUJ22_00055 [Candidatus Nomurabacteria bacterium CG1_02_31_12]PIR68934.1 MAG: hypothetical protein COU48_01345 [Candidatus Nomurabacteria bacterium CG10_big_fil_rev_8_21_14_0_10_03_31_7]PIZ87418.1 MAG: hypothetical protein COX93_01035 [Candidatus Nomurabacteria bacterium CG_4_10_14_0_2_um_filter_30_12]
MKVIISDFFSRCGKLKGKMISSTFLEVLKNLKKDYCVLLEIRNIEPIEGEVGLFPSISPENGEIKISEIFEKGYRISFSHSAKSSFYHIELRPLYSEYFYDSFDLNITIEKNGCDYYNGLVPNEVKILRNDILKDLMKALLFL